MLYSRHILSYRYLICVEPLFLAAFQMKDNLNNWRFHYVVFAFWMYQSWDELSFLNLYVHFSQIWCFYSWFIQTGPLVLSLFYLFLGLLQCIYGSILQCPINPSGSLHFSSLFFFSSCDSVSTKILSSSLIIFSLVWSRPVNFL